MATIYRRGKSWWLRDGAFRKPLNTKSRRLAMLLLEDYEEEKLRPKKVTRLQTAISDYLRYTQPFVKPSTYSDKTRILGKFLASCGDLRLYEIKLDHLNKYLQTRHNLSPYRWNTERQTLATFFNWAITGELYKAINPVRPIRKKTEPRGKAAFALSQSKIKKILLVTKKNEDLNEAFRFALNTGMRIQEIENQQWADLDLRNNSTKIQAHDDGWTPKDYEARTVPLNLAAIRITKRREKLKALSHYVFCNSQGQRHGRDWVTALSRAMRRAEIPHGGWHLSRHTFATRAVEAGMDLESLRLIMGHADTRTLLKYVHVSPQYKARVAKKLRIIG